MPLWDSTSQRVYNEQLRTEMRSMCEHDDNYSTKTLLSSPSVDILLNRTKYDHRVTAYMKAVPLNETLGTLRNERSSGLAALGELERAHERMWAHQPLETPTKKHMQPPASRERSTLGTPFTSVRGERKLWNYDHTWYHHEALRPAHVSARASRRELTAEFDEAFAAGSEAHAPATRHRHAGLGRVSSHSSLQPSSEVWPWGGESRAGQASRSPRRVAHYPSPSRRLGMHAMQKWG